MNSSSSYAGTAALPASIRKTLTNTFISVGGMWAITAVASALSLHARLGAGASLALFIASIVVIFGVHLTRKSAIGLVLLAVFSAIQGVALGPMLNHYLHMKAGSDLVMLAAGLTAAATFACAGYAVTTRKSFSHLSGFLFAGLIIVVVGSIVGIFLHSTLFHLVLSIATALLFTVYLLFDISEVVTGRETNYISAALSVYLDMLNLALALLRILGILSSDD